MDYQCGLAHPSTASHPKEVDATIMDPVSHVLQLHDPVAGAIEALLLSIVKLVVIVINIERID
jgi:hypothetical protein